MFLNSRPLFKVWLRFFMKVCIFVDGENFRRSIGGVFQNGEFDTRDYLPKAANWAGLFDFVVQDMCGNGSSRLRTYWYVLEWIDFFPWKIPKVDKEQDTLRIVLSKNEDYRKELESLNDTALTQRMRELAEALESRKVSIKRRFDGWHNIQDGIANKHQSIEFRRAGAISYNLFQDSFGQEKAVDVMLATDMLALKDIYDVAILFSGDQDYVPAVKRVKDYGKKVYNVSFETKNQKLLPGGARRLNNITDHNYTIKYDTLKDYLLPILN